jgi:hypothetical protein
MAVTVTQRDARALLGELETKVLAMAGSATAEPSSSGDR